MPRAYTRAALYSRKLHNNRPDLRFNIMSNKFALSDIERYAQPHVSVALVSWPDSPKISPLVLEVSIPSGDWALAQSLDSSCDDVDRVLSLADCCPAPVGCPRDRRGTSEQPRGRLRHCRHWNHPFSKEIAKDNQRQDTPSYGKMLERGRRAYGGSGLERTVPSLLIEPKRQDRTRSTRPIKRCP